jgi:hypothetical protein
VERKPRAQHPEFTDITTSNLFGDEEDEGKVEEEPEEEAPKPKALPKKRVPPSARTVERKPRAPKQQQQHPAFTDITTSNLFGDEGDEGKEEPEEAPKPIQRKAIPKKRIAPSARMVERKPRAPHPEFTDITTSNLFDDDE